MQPITKSLGKKYAFSTKKRGMLSVIVMTEATLLFLCCRLPFLAFSLYGLLFSWLRLCLLTSIAVCAVFYNPSSFSRSPRVWLQPVLLSGIRIIPAASVLMADRMISFTSSVLSGLLRESVLLAETSWIASFTG